eukprot:6486226-Alexandrium_andersonii.AAC.1
MSAHQEMQTRQVHTSQRRKVVRTSCCNTHTRCSHCHEGQSHSWGPCNQQPRGQSTNCTSRRGWRRGNSP